MTKAKEFLESMELDTTDNYGRNVVTGNVLDQIEKIGLLDDVYGMSATVSNDAMTMYFVDEDDDIITCIITNDENDVPIAVLVPGQDYPIVLDLEGLIPQDEHGFIDFYYDNFGWMTRSFIKTVFTAGSIGADDQYGDFGEAIALINGRKGTAIAIRSPQALHPAVLSRVQRELGYLDNDEYTRSFDSLNNFASKMRDLYGI